MHFFTKFYNALKYVNSPAIAEAQPINIKQAVEGHAVALGYEDPDAEVFSELSRPTLSPVQDFHAKIKSGEIAIESAYVFKGRRAEGFNFRESKYGTRMDKSAVKGKLLQKPYMIEKMDGNGYKKLVEDCFGYGGNDGTNYYDPNQYNEYTPFMPGPFFKQLYLYDRQLMYARTFEMWNHNPLVRTAILLRRDYVIGRRVGVRETKEGSGAKDIWERFDKEFSIQKKLRNYWVPALFRSGTLFINNLIYRSYDEGTILEIITDPNNVDDVYYYYQSFSSPYQIFSGMDVPGVSGSKDTKGSKYTIAQIPYDQVIHTKVYCDESEKFGRSLLYPNMGNLKRFKDILNARTIGEWVRSSVLFDDEIDGSPTDINNHVAKFGRIPKGSHIFGHSPKIKRTVIQPTGGAERGSFLSELVYIIATGMQLPKEFFNIAWTGNTRASAILAGEPFQKSIESDQLIVEDLLHRLAASYWKSQGLVYDNDLEFIFPSVIKDTTSEMLKNISFAEQNGWISKPTAAPTAAAELNITNFDFEREKKQIADDKEAGLNSAMGFGDMPINYAKNATPISDAPESDVYGSGKEELKKQLKTF